MFPLEIRIVPIYSRLVAIFVSSSSYKGTKAMVTDYSEEDYNDVQLTNEPEAKQTNNWSIPVLTL